MKSKDEMQDTISKRVFGADAIEIKVTIPDTQIKDGARLMEVSIKTPTVQAAAAIGGFKAFLAEVGAEHDRDQQTKTRWALDHHAAKIIAAQKNAAPEVAK